MASTSTSSLLFHGYIFGTAFWYALRGFCRIYDPVMVLGWFRPPIDRALAPNDLEKYNVWTDGWCLVTLALLLLSLSGAVPARAHAIDASNLTQRAHAYYAKAAVAITTLHHIATGYGAYHHYKLPTHYNLSMGIGVWGNVWLTLVGVVTLVSLLAAPQGSALSKTK